ncbi:LANO_0F02410g1_1 [Lachancea nothofagi CBS 11611]|uniref:Glucosidase II subunit alpha n=1 Tax=Lachancea nothofagi CBS 11611 TaxID=1266666 RepID=A0A1G4K6U0_9SACH|nr:LANO_0F02410g1_1 [Lachancea nothofagi CBS 11611]
MHLTNFASRILLVLVLIGQTLAFTDYLLKSCSQSGFCLRNRHYAREMQKARKQEAYSIDPTSIQTQDTDHSFQANILKRVPSQNGGEASGKTIVLPLFVDILDGGKVRFKINELRNSTLERGVDVINPKRYDEAYMWAFDKSANVSPADVDISTSYWPSRRDDIEIKSKDSEVSVRVHLTKFRIEIFYRGKLVLVVNDRMLLNVEHQRSLQENASQKLPEELTFNDFEDSFQYSKEDSLPFGPESVALDFTLIGINDVYGIPEHADSLRLKDTQNTEPYRLFNVDVFEYNLQAKTPMYGAIPLMIGAKPGFAAGVFWVNSADTWVDIEYDESETKTHWISEAGVIDVMIFLADNPLEVTSAYTEVTGRPQLPMISSIGYHQCRWNYNDEKDVLTVDSQMDKAGIPYDFIWLDLEYTDDKKFFTWKPDAFPNPERMLRKLWKLGRNLVTLIDPHLKINYNVSELVETSKSSVRNHDDSSYHGHCWPGESIWIDTLSSSARKVWRQLIDGFLMNYDNLHIWNDMNEPSIFSGPETTAPKDLLHGGGFEERSVHNLYGLTVHEATYEAMKESYSNKAKRPFLLTRSFFAGSQRTAATWTGDNVANWDYLHISVPMCLTNNIVGYPFIGADIAGFSGDPTPELLIRWYQAGVWYPFFRGHAHIDAERREPYLLQEPVRSIVRDIIRLRYSLLPTFYTAFHVSSINGTPIMNPLFYVHPELEGVYDIDDQFYLGQTGLLVKPVTEEGATEVSVFFPSGLFYEYESMKSFSIDKPRRITIDAPLEKLPLFIEGGTIIVRRDRYRRSSKLMANDPITLLVAPNKEGRASGKLYTDDGETFAFQTGEYIDISFDYEQGVLTSRINHKPSDGQLFASKIEKIIIAKGDAAQSSSYALLKKGSNEWMQSVEYSEESNFITIKNPHLNLQEMWSMILHG